MTEKEARLMLETVWAVGCRYFDTAPLYGLGLSETRLNGFLRPKPRDSFLISTKVGRSPRALQTEGALAADPGAFFETPSRRERFDYSYDGVMRSLEFSLERLGLDEIDIVYAHDVDVTHSRQQGSRRPPASGNSWTAAIARSTNCAHPERSRRSAPASTNGRSPKRWRATGDFDLFLLAGRYTLLEQDALTSFLPLCAEKNIGVVVGGPFNSGILATGVKADAHYNYGPAPER